jgi:uncharacterized repeat protein (TIGR03803 family)
VRILYAPILASATLIFGACGGGSHLLPGTDSSNNVGTAFDGESGSAFTVLHQFKGRNDGRGPTTVLPDGTGALLGVTQNGGGDGCSGSSQFVGCGTIFELTPWGTGYVERVIHRFNEYRDGDAPYGLVRGPGRRFYGLTEDASGNGCGSVFEVTPMGQHYVERTIYHLQSRYGCGPEVVPVIGVDGAIYGTTKVGGAHGDGTIFRLTRSASGYVQSVLYNFHGGDDGSDPTGTLSSDSSGSLYGTTQLGGRFGSGVVFKLTKTANGYIESVIHRFRADEGVPFDGVTVDRRGDLLGTTGATTCGEVFRMVPKINGYRYDVLHRFSADACGPDNAVMDASGAIFGTTEFGGSFVGSRCAGNGCGTVFELLPSAAGYKLVVLHEFNGHDGMQPVAGVAMKGNTLYGTTALGGVGCHAQAGLGCGTVFSLKV